MTSSGPKDLKDLAQQVKVPTRKGRENNIVPSCRFGSSELPKTLRPQYFEEKKKPGITLKALFQTSVEENECLRISEPAQISDTLTVGHHAGKGPAAWLNTQTLEDILRLIGQSMPITQH